MTAPASPEPASAEPSPPVPKYLGLFFLPLVVAGGYFMLGGFGAFKLEPRPSVPEWLIGLIGLAFFAAGLSVMIGFYCGGLATRNGALPSGAPRGLRLVQGLLSAGVVGGLAVTALYVLFNPDPANTIVSTRMLGFDVDMEGRPLLAAAFWGGAAATGGAFLYLAGRAWLRSHHKKHIKSV